jgi:hypothetical protein
MVMAKKTGQGKDPLRLKTLTIADVEDLGKMLIEVSNHFPRSFRTEREFYPLVRSFLWGSAQGPK